MGETIPLSHKLCAFRYLNSRPQLRSQIQFKYLNEKLILSQKLCYFKEGAVSHNVFKPSTALHCSIPRRFFCQQFLQHFRSRVKNCSVTIYVPINIILFTLKIPVYFLLKTCTLDQLFFTIILLKP